MISRNARDASEVRLRPCRGDLRRREALWATPSAWTRFVVARARDDDDGCASACWVQGSAPCVVALCLCQVTTAAAPEHNRRQAFRAARRPKSPGRDSGRPSTRYSWPRSDTESPHDENGYHAHQAPARGINADAGARGFGACSVVLFLSDRRMGYDREGTDGSRAAPVRPGWWSRSATSSAKHRQQPGEGPVVRYTSAESDRVDSQEDGSPQCPPHRISIAHRQAAAPGARAHRRGQEVAPARVAT